MVKLQVADREARGWMGTAPEHGNSFLQLHTVAQLGVERQAMKQLIPPLSVVLPTGVRHALQVVQQLVAAAQPALAGAGGQEVEVQQRAVLLWATQEEGKC